MLTIYRVALIPFCLILFGALAPVRAEELTIDGENPLERSFSALENDSGFIVDRTITNFGANFFRDFSLAWRERVGVEHIDLTIIEKPSARWGSLIIVEYNNQPVASVFLQAGRSAIIKPLAINTVSYLAELVADNALLGLLVKNPDLAKEELP